MTLLNDPSARFRRNPREAAEEFRRTDPSVNRPDTMSGALQPAFNDEPQIASSTELAVQEPSWIDQQNQRLQDERSRSIQNMSSIISDRQRRQAQQGGYASDGSVQYGDVSQAGQAYTVDGSLSPERQNILRKTASYQGTPYQLGGRTARGIDCSGLVMSVYNQAGFDVSQHSAGWQGRNIPGVRTAVSNLRPGDIVAWKDGSHIAVYAGNGQIWDASRSKGTSLRPLWAPQSQVYGIAIKLPGE
jgi:cell wall-associated NlpC family hydrolase